MLNFLSAADEEGRIPINIMADREGIFDLKPNTKVNIHKPCLAQHALFVAKRSGNNVDWLHEKFSVLKRFIDWYGENCFHEETGLYFWLNDFAIGVDNDPCVFYRPDGSTASIFLNCLMYGELVAMTELCKLSGDIDEEKYAKKSEKLKQAIQNECYDDRDGFFYYSLKRKTYFIIKINRRKRRISFLKILFGNKEQESFIRFWHFFCNRKGKPRIAF